MYTCIVGRESTLPASWVYSRIRDSAAAVHEAAATLGFMLKKESIRAPFLQASLGSIIVMHVLKL